MTLLNIFNTFRLCGFIFRLTCTSQTCIKTGQEFDKASGAGHKLMHELKQEKVCGNQKTVMAKLVSMEEVLGDNLYSKICEISMCVDVEKITGMLLECEKNQILQMLSDKEVLQHYVKTASETLSDIEMNNMETHDNDPAVVKATSVNVDQDDDTDDILSVSSSKESCAEELYDRVLAILNCEILTSKITGMLLDVDFDELTEVMKSEDKLKEAIEKAKQVLTAEDLLRCTHEQISDQIYSRVKIKYPDQAPQITGMLIEMSTESLTNLLRNEAEFDIKIQEAIRVLSQHSDSSLNLML